MSETSESSTAGDWLFARTWQLTLEASAERSFNAASGALVIAEGRTMHTNVCEVVVNEPGPPFVAPALRSARP